MKIYNAKKAFEVVLGSLVLFILTGSIFGQNMFRKVNDFDGDGKADYVVTRSEGDGLKYWWIWQTTGGLKVVQFGLNTDRDASGDYDGDGKTDIGVWRPPPTNGNLSTYYILESQTGAFRYYSFYNFMLSTIMQQDYNGDGKTDPGVITGEVNPALSVVYSGGSSGFSASLPANHRIGIRIGDTDGDGRADRATYTSVNSNNTVIITNLVTNASRIIQFGLFNDSYQAVDFDGDGKGDLAVFRESNGTWWWLRSSDNVVNAVQFGQLGDRPVPADYDGDGKTDLAIWRSGTYWILGSQTGVSVFNWGISGDTPVSY